MLLILTKGLLVLEIGQISNKQLGEVEILLIDRPQPTLKKVFVRKRIKSREVIR